MISSLFILNPSGDVVLEKHWSVVHPRTVVDSFWVEAMKLGGVDSAPPIIEFAKHVCVAVQRDALIFLAIILKETAPLTVIELLHRFVDIVKQNYLTSTPVLNEEVLREHFVTLYSLLDEFLDNGFPLTTEPASLKDMVPPPQGLFQRVTSIATSNVPDASMGVVSWRKSGIRHGTNEIFFDIIEEVDAIIDVNGMVLSSDVRGRIECKCHLSGMPDVLVNFLDPSALDDVSFHPCVRYARFEADKSLSFIPPDGSFTLATYRASRPANIPLYVKPQISFNPAGGRLVIMAGMRQTTTAVVTTVEDLVVTVPLPAGCESVSTQTQGGSVKFDAHSKVLRWDIGKMSGAKTPSLDGTIRLSSVPDSSVTVLASWKISGSCISGLKIDSVNITGEAYKAFKGVRGWTKSGEYQIRT